jgi:serine/threonine protein kinase
LAREVRECDEVEGMGAYNMSGDTGSLRYMAPEVARNLPYNHKVDVYAFGEYLDKLLLCETCVKAHLFPINLMSIYVYRSHFVADVYPRSTI